MRGFHPLNPYIWAEQGIGGRLYMLFSHAMFIPRIIRRTIFVYRINRTPGPRWPYPWEDER